MSYPYYGYQNFGQPYSPPVPDQLAQMRMQQSPQMQGYQNFGQQQPQPSADDRIWVQGQNAAEAYLVAANGFVRLWDSSRQVFYEKRADSSGRPYMETYEYQRKGAESPNVGTETQKQAVDYSKEISGLKQRLAALEAHFKNGGSVDAISKSNADDTAIPTV